MLSPATPPGIASAPRSSAQFSASVAPEVKKTRPPFGSSAATWSRATSTAAAAARPALCVLDGFA
jgi:hypothetical protein